MADPDANGTVEVVYATPMVQRIETVDWAEGMSARDAVAASHLLEQFPEIGRDTLTLGIFGVVVDPNRVLAPGERVEICRPLAHDPRALRRDLVAEGKVMGAHPEAAERTRK
jgi:putative ubiquitin-RnfH superfamily antitoxin RatB of RatAB toxin-antitoxin module